MVLSVPRAAGGEQGWGTGRKATSFLHKLVSTSSPCDAGLIPVLVRLLYPKMRKRSGRLGGKGAPGSARAAILNYLAALDAAELAPLVQLFLQPVSSAFWRQKENNQSAVDAVPAPADRFALRLLSRLVQSCSARFEHRYGVCNLSAPD